MMSGLYGWLRQTWSSLVAVADMNEPTTATEPEPVGCEIFTDALDQLTDELDRLCERIDFNLDRLWECRQAKAQAEFGGIDATRQNMTKQSISGAKLILRTAGNRVNQVIGEIEIVTTSPAQQQATANE
jgi:hypothetical protein